MSLSEAEIEVRLAALRRQREALDREIADLVLYLELGRRLGATGRHPDPYGPNGPQDKGPRDVGAREMGTVDGERRGEGPRLDCAGAIPDRSAMETESQPSMRRARLRRSGVHFGGGRPEDPASPPIPVAQDAPAAGPAPRAATELPAIRVPAASGEPAPIPPAITFAEDAAGARRYGRAVVQAACAAIATAGRPLHAAAILEALLEQGFTLPGRDPVAGLNTRLWKRAGPGGPLRRVGEATYALGAASDPDPA